MTRNVDDRWPGYWDAVADQLGGVDRYLDAEHRLVVGWFALHWDVTEPLTDDSDLGHIRAQSFDAIDLRHRFQVIAINLGDVIRLVDFSLVP